eukprot:749891-Hanusia_phi.AAC.4
MFMPWERQVTSRVCWVNKSLWLKAATLSGSQMPRPQICMITRAAAAARAKILKTNFAQSMAAEKKAGYVLSEKSTGKATGKTAIEMEELRTSWLVYPRQEKA